MLCEMCGKDVEGLNRVEIEGSVLSLCAECSRFGKIVVPAPVPPSERRAPSLPAGTIDARLGQRTQRMTERDLFRELPEMELAEDWSKRVRLAREKLAWSPEDLAKKLNEKKSVVLKIEAGSFRPPDGQIRKIEQMLKIRLRASPSDAT
ncbi:MAG: multiprotein bridging factor aMBF1 [Thermoplasmata archaeon]|nr:multiprotein bridging factor aMBF1 [Thermoplasmata archaeon]